MRAPSNTYLPLTLAPSEAREIVIEEVVEVLPLYDGRIQLRNIEPTLTLGVTADTVLIVQDAGIGFDGEWENRFVDTTLAPEAWLGIGLTVSCADAVYVRHRITITNPSISATATLHLLVNGSKEVLTPPPTPTYVVIP